MSKSKEPKVDKTTFFRDISIFSKLEVNISVKIQTKIDFYILCNSLKYIYVCKETKFNNQKGL